MNHVALRPRQGEGRLHNYNYWQYLGVGGSWGEVELFGGEASPALPPLDETLMVPMHDSNVVILHWYQCTTVHW